MNNMNKIALTLSFIFPGFGQMWNREYIKGINFTLLQVIFIILVFYPGSNLFSIGMVTIPILWIWGMVDASRLFYIYSSEHRRAQRRRSIRLALGIIAFGILSEAIFVPTILTIRRNYKTTSEEYIYKSELSEIPSDVLNHPENREGAKRTSNDISPNAPISENSTSGFELQQKQYRPSNPDNEDTSRLSAAVHEVPTPNPHPPPAPSGGGEGTAERSEHASASSPWVVTVSVSEKYNEISKLYLELRKQYQVQIIPVSSNPKQNAYAVAITGFANILDAENFVNKLRKDIPKCFVASYENPAIPVK